MKDNDWTIQNSKELLKYQLFSLLEVMPKDFQNTRTLRKIIEELFADVLYFSAKDSRNAHLLLTDAWYQIEQKLNALSSEIAHTPVDY